MSLLTAIRRRKIFQIATVYAVVGWLVVQVVVAIESPLSLPDWFDTAMIVLVIAGFPISLVFAWSHGDHGRAARAVSDDDGGRDAASTAPELAPPSTAATPKPKVAFCTAPDGVRIAFATMGAGSPVVKTANWLSHVELDVKSPIYAHMIRDLAANFMLTVYDERLSGLSDWEAGDASLDAFVEDLEAVRRAAGLERFSIFALSQGCPVSVAYAARYPDRVERMVLLGGFARNFREGEGEVEAIATLIESGWGRDNPAFRQIFSTSLIPNATKEELDSLNELQRLSATPENAARLFRAVHAIDVRELAPRVRAPTLVLHCRDEAGVPVELGRELAALIPGARFVGLPGKNHLLLERDEAYAVFKDEAFPFLSGET